MLALKLIGSVQLKTESHAKRWSVLLQKQIWMRMETEQFAQLAATIKQMGIPEGPWGSPSILLGSWPRLPLKTTAGVFHPKTQQQWLRTLWELNRENRSSLLPTVCLYWTSISTSDHIHDDDGNPIFLGTKILILNPKNQTINYTINFSIILSTQPRRSIKTVMRDLEYSRVCTSTESITH